jgi:hypothetical protein
MGALSTLWPGVVSNAPFQSVTTLITDLTPCCSDDQIVLKRRKIMSHDFRILSFNAEEGKSTNRIYPHYVPCRIRKRGSTLSRMARNFIFLRPDSRQQFSERPRTANPSYHLSIQSFQWASWSPGLMINLQSSTLAIPPLTLFLNSRTDSRPNISMLKHR